MPEHVHQGSVPNSPLGPADKVLDTIPGRTPELIIGILASLAAAAFICVHWSVAVVGGLAILALSFAENEQFILWVIFLLPVGRIVSADVPVKNVTVALRVLVVAGFFLGRLFRGQWDGKAIWGSPIS